MNFPLCALLFTLNACDGQQRAPAPSVIVAAAEKPQGDVVSALGKNIDWILEDKKGDHWFASNGDGVYHYDGRVLLHFTTKHGLCSDHVWSIQEDMNGYLWCSTRDGFCRFDGKGFTDFTATIKNALTMPVHLVKGGLCFGHAEGICYYDGRTFTNFTIHPVGYEPERSNMSRPYSIYCGLEDRSGNLWFGTEQSVLRKVITVAGMILFVMLGALLFEITPARHPEFDGNWRVILWVVFVGVFVGSGVLVGVLVGVATVQAQLRSPVNSG